MKKRGRPTELNSPVRIIFQIEQQTYKQLQDTIDMPVSKYIRELITKNLPNYVKYSN
jgi:hypothetical protein